MAEQFNDLQQTGLNHLELRFSSRCVSLTQVLLIKGRSYFFQRKFRATPNILSSVSGILGVFHGQLELLPYFLDGQCTQSSLYFKVLLVRDEAFRESLRCLFSVVIYQ